MKSNNIDDLIHRAVFGETEEIRGAAHREIRETAKKQGIFSASILPLYHAVGNQKVSGFTVPAFNIRTLTYDTAAIIFSLAQEKKVGAFIFEIARSEIGYTAQRPMEFGSAVLAGAIKSGWKGPVFIQGDHYQFKASSYKKSPKGEQKKIKELIKESIEGGFYNIDIDASTLVDLEKETLDAQQKANYEETAHLTKYIRSIQPDGVTISIGGEIGHIGGKNSTVAEFEAFMKGYLSRIEKARLEEISKVSVQTGTSHGGIPLPDGTIKEISLDFSVLENIGRAARAKYHIGGAVQHGASTLPGELFHRFPEVQTLEIHLATGFQNIVYEHLPQKLTKEMYQYLKEKEKDEWKEGWTSEQFVYKMRKKALGPFKKKLWTLPERSKKPLLAALKNQFAFLFEKLRVFDTRKIVSTYVS